MDEYVLENSIHFPYTSKQTLTSDGTFSLHSKDSLWWHILTLLALLTNTSYSLIEVVRSMTTATPAFRALFVHRSWLQSLALERVLLG